MTHVATAGIWITGQRIKVNGNTISNTVPQGNRDADGMRFFGNGHRITDITIFDISDAGYANPPHPDCFQTYDKGSPTFDVVISGNTCRNVGAQCLIATATKAATVAPHPAPPRSPSSAIPAPQTVPRRSIYGAGPTSKSTRTRSPDPI